MKIDYDFFEHYLDISDMAEFDRNDFIYGAIKELEKQYNKEVILHYFVSPLSRNKDSMLLDFECLCSDKTLERKLSQLLEGRFLIPLVLCKDLLEIDRVKSEIWASAKLHKNPKP